MSHHHDTSDRRLTDYCKAELSCLTREGLLDVGRSLEKIAGYFENGGKCRDDIHTAKRHIVDLADFWGSKKQRRKNAT